MRLRIGRSALVLLASALLGACAGTTTPRSRDCLVVSAGQGGERLGAWPVPPDPPLVTIRYLHSVTLTPVVEVYRVGNGELLQIEIRFSEHGPGLPTQADAGADAAFTRENGQFVVRLARSFHGISARVDPAQQPRLTVGAESIDLAQWGTGSLHIGTRPGRCPEP